MIEQFKLDILEGLGKPEKTLPSKYFYDQKGDKLFQEIMALPEYYLTRSELLIFQSQAADIVSSFACSKNQKFELIELGAGDGTKTIELLKELTAQGYDYDYVPIDISQNALDGLHTMLQLKMPTLKIKPQQGTYFGVLQDLKHKEIPKVILFLGSNLGNLDDSSASQFLYQLGANLSEGDKILLGLDQIKPKHLVLPAYNDSKGITREFNLNLLDRINRDLGGNFNREHFDHAPEYDELEGIAKSYIVSLADQEVHIKALNRSFQFAQGEKIHTEISRKYTDAILNQLLEPTDFEWQHKFHDPSHYFANYVLQKKQ